MDSMPVRVARSARPAWRHLPALPVAALLLVAPPRPASARPGQDELAAGDQHYRAGRLAEARAAYTEAVRAAPLSATALCRKARAGSELGETLKGDEQRMTFAESVADAREAVRLGPESGDAHMWLAIALGRLALREGPRTRNALGREIRAEADRALALDPRLAGAWHVLGVWNQRVSGLNAVERLVARAFFGGVQRGASYENAEQAFRKAIELEPDAIHHRLAYARLLRERKRHADARRELEQALSLPPTGGALDALYQEQARALMEKLPKR
jgi:tetratricopeptide (TPR) repeat protein